jgi:hypothetical protein
MKKTIPIILICLLAVPALLRSDTRGSVHGKLLDPTDAVIPGATVQLVSVLDGQQRTAVTDAQGHFNFLFLDAGPYRLSAAVEGFQKVAEQMTIVSGRLLEVNLRLKELSEVAGEITVTDSAADTAATFRYRIRFSSNNLAAITCSMSGITFRTSAGRIPCPPRRC